MIRTGKPVPFSSIEDELKDEGIDTETGGLDDQFGTFWKANHPEVFEDLVGRGDQLFGSLLSNYKGFLDGFSDLF